MGGVQYKEMDRFFAHLSDIPNKEAAEEVFAKNRTWVGRALTWKTPSSADSLSHYLRTYTPNFGDMSTGNYLYAGRANPKGANEEAYQLFTHLFDAVHRIENFSSGEEKVKIREALHHFIDEVIKQNGGKDRDGWDRMQEVVKLLPEDTAAALLAMMSSQKLLVDKLLPALRGKTLEEKVSLLQFFVTMNFHSNLSSNHPIYMMDRFSPKVYNDIGQTLKLILLKEESKDGFTIKVRGRDHYMLNRDHGLSPLLQTMGTFFEEEDHMDVREVIQYARDRLEHNADDYVTDIQPIIDAFKLGIEQTKEEPQMRGFQQGDESTEEKDDL